MTEAAKVRLVRCPKCENLLPELTDYSVYQCGGCGAVLRGKNKNGELREIVPKAEEEAVGGIVEKPENFDHSESKLMNVTAGSGYDAKSNSSSSSTRERRRALRDSPEVYATSSMNAKDSWASEDDRVMHRANNGEQSQETMAREFEQSCSHGEEIEPHKTGRDLFWRSRERSEAEVMPRARRADLERMKYASSINSEEGLSGYSLGSNYDGDKRSFGMDVDGFGHDERIQENMAKEIEKFNSGNGKEIETRKKGQVPHWRSRERGGAEVLPRARRADLEGMRYGSSINSDEGLSGGSDYNSDKRLFRKDTDGFIQDEQIQENVAKAFEHFDSLNGKEIETQRVGQVPDWKRKGRSAVEVLPRARRTDLEGVKYASSVNSDDGPSGYWPSSNYDNDDKRLYRTNMDGFNQVDSSVDDRAELLRKFNELKDQLSRLGDISEKPNERVPLERQMNHEESYDNSYDRFPESSTRVMNRASAQNHVSGERASYKNHYNMPTRFVNAHDMSDGGFHHPSERIHGYGGPPGSQLLSRDPYQAQTSFHLQPMHPRFLGRSMDDEIPATDPYLPYPPQMNPHHPSCNCFHCCNANQIRNRGPPAAYGDRRFSDIPQNPMFYRHQNSGAFGKRDYSPRSANPHSLNKKNSQSQMTHSGDLHSGKVGFARRHPPRVQSSGQLCRPVAGGAPFLTCYNCLGLLQLPKKVLHGGKKQKMKCGACSTVMVIAVSGNSLAIAFDKRAGETSDKIDHRRDGRNSFSNGHTNNPSMTFSSEDYDTARYDFHAMDQELGSLSTGHGSSSKSVGIRSLYSESTCSSREGENLTNSTIAMDKSDSELLVKGKVSPPVAGSPLQEYFEYSNKYHAVNRLDNGNRSARSDAEKVMPNKAARQNSTEDTASATEIDIPANEYANTGSSFESGESSKGEQLRATKESFFSGIIKKSFKEFSRSNLSVEEEKSNTTVNGHLIPHRVLKKAEKVAGPIQPGHYWYDFRAGFWGVIGGHCMGIIPPFIEEFNYPMPENCAGGNTGVFVNGRELDPKDLKLLSSRGLPIERDRSYIIEISGRVLDEDSGAELESLGKLAPTVEKAKHGFGMRPPKVAA